MVIKQHQPSLKLKTLQHTVKLFHSNPRIKKKYQTLLKGKTANLPSNQEIS